jgi:UDP-N-acetylglucosamine--N-acetylmuramyl-(pentapeptide) pyrophosphoryl-undecaprenol N-acetylglucosamine transferase
MTERTVVLAAGGTGGHMFPARALAEALVRRGVGVALITDARGAGFGDGLAGVQTFRIVAGSPSGSPVQRLKGMARLARGYLQSKSLLRQLRPECVVGFGGYPSAPALMAASRMGLATVIHEQNAVLGRANRLLARRVDAIAVAHDQVSGVADEDRGKLVKTGNPVRAAVAALRDDPYPAPVPNGELRLLVLGGSQGARILSEVVPQAIARLPETKRARLSVVQQCREEDLARVREVYAAYHVRGVLQTFFADLPERLHWCQLLIARAGASTVAEISVAGRPAILVPYAAATDDHQAANARTLAAAGGAWMMREESFQPEALSARLEFYLRQPTILARAAERAHEVGLPDAADRLADLVLRQAAGGANGGGAGRGGRSAAVRADPNTLRGLAA